MKLLKCVLMILVAFHLTGFAANYYVDQNHASSDNANPGTEALPLKTIQSGVGMAQPGDSVIVKGSADSASAQAIYNVSGNGITTVRNGEENNEIVIKTYPGHTVIVKGPGYTGDGIELNNSYHQFFGFKFTDFKKATEGSATKTNLRIEKCEFTITTETGLRLRNIKNLVIRDCHIHHCFESGVSLRGCSNCLFERVESSFNSDGQGESGDGDGFHSLDGDSIDFIDCIARNNSEDGFDITSNGTLLNCISSGHTACNVKLWRRDDDDYAPKLMTIINALIYNAGQCGIKISRGAQLRLFNSVIYGNGEEGIAFRGISISKEPAVVESELVNNIIAKNSKKATWAKGIDVKQSGPNVNKVTANYNFYHNNVNANSGLDSDNNAVIFGSPGFVDAANGDFRLTGSSAAIDAGITNEVYQSLNTLYGVDLTADFNGEIRPYDNVWDIGAFEYPLSTGIMNGSVKKQSSYVLKNYPNPFNPQTTIHFEIPEASQVKMEIFNVRGRKVVTLTDDDYSAGVHTTTWNGKDNTNNFAGTGVYYYQMKTEEHILTGKMILLR